MFTIGFMNLEASELDYIPVSGHIWRAVLITGKDFARSISKAELDAVAILGANPRNTQLAKTALLRKKHTLVEFPAALTMEQARQLEKIASDGNIRLFSPNLMKTEPGFKTLKSNVESSWNQALSITMTCGVNSRPLTTAFIAKLIQLFDVIEWVTGSRIAEVQFERSGRGSQSLAVVLLSSLANGMRVLLNMYSVQKRNPARLWVDLVLKDSALHVDPFAQSINMLQFQPRTCGSISWETSSLIATIEMFANCVNVGNCEGNFENLDRFLSMARNVVKSQVSAR